VYSFANLSWDGKVQTGVYSGARDKTPRNASPLYYRYRSALFIAPRDGGGRAASVSPEREGLRTLGPLLSELENKWEPRHGFSPLLVALLADGASFRRNSSKIAARNPVVPNANAKLRKREHSQIEMTLRICVRFQMHARGVVCSREKLAAGNSRRETERSVSRSSLMKRNYRSANLNSESCAVTASKRKTFHTVIESQ